MITIPRDIVVRTSGNTKEQDFDMAPSLVACDDNDTVLRTLVYSKRRHVKRRPPLLFSPLFVPLLSTLLSFIRVLRHRGTTLFLWHSWANFHFADTWLLSSRNSCVPYLCIPKAFDSSLSLLCAQEQSSLFNERNSREWYKTFWVYRFFCNNASMSGIFRLRKANDVETDVSRAKD